MKTISREIREKISETKRHRFEAGILKSYIRDFEHKQQMSELKKRQWRGGKVKKRVPVKNKFGFSYEDLTQQYWVEGKSLSEIGEEFGTDASLILHWFRKWGIPRRPPSLEGKSQSYALMRARAFYYKKHECERCLATDEYLVVHHRDGNHNNNDLSNLALVCQHCHQKIHHEMPISSKRRFVGWFKRCWRNCARCELLPVCEQLIKLTGGEA